MAKMTSELDEADAGCSSGAKYLGGFLLSFPQIERNYISFAQFVYFLREVCLLFTF